MLAVVASGIITAGVVLCPSVTVAQPAVLLSPASVSLSVQSPTVIAGEGDSVEVMERPTAGHTAVAVGVDRMPAACMINGGNNSFQVPVPAGDAARSYSVAWSPTVHCTVWVNGYVILSDGTKVTTPSKKITVAPSPPPTPPPSVPAGALAATFTGPKLSGVSQFGSAVAVSGSIAAVGDFFVNHNTGAVYVYQNTTAGWELSAVLHGTGAGRGSNFGQSVAIAGSTIVVGASFEYASQYGAPRDGRVYLFSRSGGHWRQTQQLAGSLTPPDLFGINLTATPNTIAVANFPLGYRTTNVDFLYLYTRGHRGWSLSQRLPIEAGSLAISGTTLAVGGPGGNGPGFVWVFRESHDRWRLVAHLSGTRSLPSAGFGSAVAISGSRIAVAASNAGRVYTYLDTRSGWKAQNTLVGQVPFGRALAMDGSRLDVTAGQGVSSDQLGPIDVYTPTASGWRGLGVLQTSAAPTGFGTSLAISASLTLVGAPGTTFASAPDAAYLFHTPATPAAATARLPVLGSKAFAGPQGRGWGP